MENKPNPSSENFPVGCPFIMELPSKDIILCGREDVPVFICGCDPQKKSERIWCEFHRCLLTHASAGVIVKEAKR